MKLWKILAPIALCLVLALAIVPATADAATNSGTCGENVTWTLDDTGTLTISGTGPMEDYSSNPPWSSVKVAVIQEGVTTIGNYAFSHCSNLTSVTIPDSVTTIGERAFKECTSLTAVTIPNRVTTIGKHAFSYCTRLTDLTLGNGLTTIDSSAFYECDGLVSVTVPNTVTTIGSAAFSWCSNLVSVKLGNSVTTIGGSAFSNCISLTSMTIPDSVTTLDTNAFWQCTGLTNVVIGSGITTINSRTFEGCTKLVSITIPDSVTTIDKRAFLACSSLSNMMLPSSLTTIGEQAFTYCNCLSNVTIPGNVTAIGDYAFSQCEGLTAVTISDGVTAIGYGMFFYCESLASVTIPDSVTTVSDSAFHANRKLNDVWYTGTSADRETISIGSSNDSLVKATWHYDACYVGAEHTYDNTCDTDCNVCGKVRTITHTYDNGCDTDCNVCNFARTVPGHNYTLNGNHTCDICKYSKTPVAPVVEKKTNSSVTLAKTDGFEYSKDGKTWQTSNIFANLAPDTTYTFYQRVKASSVALVSEISEGAPIPFKSAQAAPAAPIISSFTDTAVTLIPVVGVEYSADGETWQASNVFTDLTPGTKYTFYQRYPETETHEASDLSACTAMTTDKSKQTLIPAAPTAESVTTDSITLVTVDGCEYSRDGKTWQASNVFADLSCSTEYTFYQRYAETATTYAGKSSDGLVIRTEKGPYSKPAAPTLLTKTHNSVTLVAVSGCEYSRDGINWQASNVFTGLDPETNYLFYQRYAETDTHFASEASAALRVRTNEEPTYIPGELDGDGEVTTDDAVYLLLAVLFGTEDYPVPDGMDLDFDGSGEVDTDDAVYLLLHVLFGAEDYPLYG